MKTIAKYRPHLGTVETLECVRIRDVLLTRVKAKLPAAGDTRTGDAISRSRALWPRGARLCDLVIARFTILFRSGGLF